MEILRIVVTGNVGAGKTSFIRTISEIDVVDTDRRATDELVEIKANTTVALDFGRLTISPNQSLHLYGTPGQARFDFMWDILIQKAHAYILLIDAHRPEHLRQNRKILHFCKQRTNIPYLVGITHSDCPGAWEAEDIALGLGIWDDSVPFVTVNATEPVSVRSALITLVESLTDCYLHHS
ncbi:MAG: ATP/GTP-binding protein [Calothrix sp. C42_A2020_038]|nr:ATP/GTP-binding protein [Calothrix sp. C42_A2020_038]